MRKCQQKLVRDLLQTALSVPLEHLREQEKVLEYLQELNGLSVKLNSCVVLPAGEKQKLRQDLDKRLRQATTLRLSGLLDQRPIETPALEHEGGVASISVILAGREARETKNQGAESPLEPRYPQDEHGRLILGPDTNLLKNQSDSFIVANAEIAMLRCVNLERCVLLLRGITFSLYLENCSDCVCVARCRQLRLLNCQRVTSAISCKTKPFLEECSCIVFTDWPMDEVANAPGSLLSSTWRVSEAEVVETGSEDTVYTCKPGGKTLNPSLWNTGCPSVMEMLVLLGI